MKRNRIVNDLKELFSSVSMIDPGNCKIYNFFIQSLICMYCLSVTTRTDSYVGGQKVGQLHSVIHQIYT